MLMSLVKGMWLVTPSQFPVVIGGGDTPVDASEIGPLTPITPIGSFVADFVALDLDRLDSFRSFAARFGLEAILPFLPSGGEAARDPGSRRTVEVFLPTNQVEKEPRMYALRIPARDHPPKMQEVLRTLVERWFDDAQPEAAGLSPAERFRKMPDDRFARALVDCRRRLRPHDADMWATLLSRDGNPDQSGVEVEADLPRSKAAVVEEVWEAPDVFSACCLDIAELLKANLSLRKCRYCGAYFVPQRSEELYCRRPVRERRSRKPRSAVTPALLTCRDIGPQWQYRESLREDPLKQAYRRAYMRQYMRLRSLGKEPKQVAEQIQPTPEEAKQKMDEVRSGKMTLSQYEAWLSVQGRKAAEPQWGVRRLQPES